MRSSGVILRRGSPSLSSTSPRLGIIDGFAGPGEYEGGEPGSPVIILETILTHRLKHRMREVVLLFIEREAAVAEYLEGLLVRRFQAYCPEPIGDGAYALEGGRVKFQILHGEFEAALGALLDDLQGRQKQLAPCFAFIDPFGPSGMPMDLVARFMQYAKSETLINFAFDPVNRFLTAPTHERIFDKLYGCPHWREFRKEEGTKRHKGLLDLYISQIKSAAGAQYVLPFTMRDTRNRELYHLVFATKHPSGLDHMKQAMWRVDPSGNFQFSDYAYNPSQVRLFPPEPDFGELAELIWQHFRGLLVPSSEVRNWVVTDTKYATNHVVRALTILEEEGRLRKYVGIWSTKGCLKGEPYKRKGAFPNSVVIEFLDA